MYVPHLAFTLHPVLHPRCSLTCKIKKPQGCKSGAESRMGNVLSKSKWGGGGGEGHDNMGQKRD